MLSKQELYDLIPMDYKETKGLDSFTYMCVDEELGIYTIDYNLHFWSGSTDQEYHKPDYIVVKGVAYWFATNPFYDGAPYDGMLVFKKMVFSYPDGTKIIPKMYLDKTTKQMI